MSETFRMILEYFQSVNRTGMYYGLFAVALLLIVYMAWLDRDEFLTETGHRLLIATLFLSFVMLCPVTAYVLVKHVTWSYGYAQFMRLLPLTPVIAYAGVSAAKHVFDKHSGVALYPAILLILIALSGSLFPYATNFSMRGNFTTGEQRKERAELDDIIADILIYTGEENAALLTNYNRQQEETILLEEEPVLATYTPVLVSDEEVLSYVRTVDGSIHYLYGRDMWNGNVNREVPYDGTYRYDDNTRNLYVALTALCTVKAENAADTVYTYAGADGEEETKTARELAEEVSSCMDLSTANLLILPASSLTEEVTEVLNGHAVLWLFGEYYAVYLWN